MTTLREQVEEIVAEAYDIGHAHGMNVLRFQEGMTPKRVDEGWGPLVDRILALRPVERSGGEE